MENQECLSELEEPKSRSAWGPIRCDAGGVMIEDRAMVAVIEDDYRILVCCFAGLKPLDRNGLAVKAAENNVVVVEEFFEVARCDSDTRVALEVLRDEQGMMCRFRHDGARETLRRDDGPLSPQSLLEKRDSARVRRLVALDLGCPAEK